MPLRQRTRTARRLRRAATDAEIRLWRALSDAFPGKGFRRQHPIGRCIVDFACPAHKLAIEIDGGQHAEQLTADELRTEEIARHGYGVIRFWNNEVLRNLPGVLKTIEAELAASQRGRGGSRRSPLAGAKSERTAAVRLCEVLAEAAAALAEAGFEQPRRQARRLVAAALGLSAAFVLAHPERPLEPAERRRFDAFLQRTLAHEPLSRIEGHREFWGLDFALSPETLDPRPDSETLVEAVLRRLPDRRAPLLLLDLGTGTGCLLLALLSELPAARGVGVDIALGAAATARGNARALGLGDRASFLVGDWGEALKGPFDVVVANPPYIATPAIPELPREVRDYDPRRALDGGPDGLGAYRALAPDAARLLKPGGFFACEIGIGQEGAVGAIFAEAGLVVAGAEPDLAGIPRALLARPSPSGDKKTVGKRAGRD